MAKPTAPEWATNTVLISEPAQGKKESGWSTSNGQVDGTPEKPPLQQFNWFMNACYTALDYILKRITSGKESPVTISSNVLTPITGGNFVVPESGGADSIYGIALDNIEDGDVISISVNTPGHIITVANNTVSTGARIYTQLGTGKKLTDEHDIMYLRRVGASMYEIGGSVSGVTDEVPGTVTSRQLTYGAPLDGSNMIANGDFSHPLDNDRDSGAGSSLTTHQNITKLWSFTEDYEYTDMKAIEGVGASMTASVGATRNYMTYEPKIEFKADTVYFLDFKTTMAGNDSQRKMSIIASDGITHRILNIDGTTGTGSQTLEIDTTGMNVDDITLEFYWMWTLGGTKVPHMPYFHIVNTNYISVDEITLREGVSSSTYSPYGYSKEYEKKFVDYFYIHLNGRSLVKIHDRIYIPHEEKEWVKSISTVSFFSRTTYFLLADGAGTIQTLTGAYFDAFSFNEDIVRSGLIILNSTDTVGGTTTMGYMPHDGFTFLCPLPGQFRQFPS